MSIHYILSEYVEQAMSEAIYDKLALVGGTGKGDRLLF